MLRAMAVAFTRAEVFSENLKGTMERLNLSRRELARRLYPEDPELGRSNVRRSLRGLHEPTRHTVEVYAAALEIEPDELLPEEDEQEAAQDVGQMLADLEARVRKLKKVVRKGAVRV
jgi:transcriptional regulator with XRE-family HTH domain